MKTHFHFYPKVAVLALLLVGSFLMAETSPAPVGVDPSRAEAPATITHASTPDAAPAETATHAPDRRASP